MEQITDEKRQKAADVARKLAVEVENGAKFGTHWLSEGGAPHCVLGHWAHRSELSFQYPSQLGLSSYGTSNAVWQANDRLFQYGGPGRGTTPADLALALRNLAADIDQHRNLPNLEA